MKLLPKQYGKILYELTKGASAKEIDKITEQFIVFLTQERVVSKIDYIVKEFVDYAKEETGIKQLKIKSARVLSKSEINKIAKYLGEKTEIETEVDQGLLGGVIIRDKNKILDASLKTQLNKLKTQLI